MVSSTLGRMKGLMFSSKPRTVVLEARSEDISMSSIHMFFMRFPIDVIWLDSSLTVVDTYENAKPWSLKVFKPGKPARYVVETPSGIISETKTDTNDKLLFL